MSYKNSIIRSAFGVLVLFALGLPAVSAQQLRMAQKTQQSLVPGVNGNPFQADNAASRTLPTSSSSAQAARPLTYQQDLQQKVNALRSKSSAKLTGSAASTSAHPDAAAPLSVNFPGFSKVPSFAAADTNGYPPYVGLTTDVNNDGKPDLVTFQFYGEMNVSLNPGTSDFSKWAVTYTNTAGEGTGVGIIGAQAVDVNGDGYPDLVASDVNGSRALVYINKKDGTFADPISVPMLFDISGYFNGVLVADVNGDGKPDLIGFNRGAVAYPVTIGLLVRLGNGDGTFAAPLPEQDSIVQNCSEFQMEYSNIMAADMNKDGKIDLVFPYSAYDYSDNNSLQVAVLTGNGDGTFNNLPTTTPPTESYPGYYIGYYVSYSDKVYDLDGDGNLDVVFSNGGDGIWVAYGKGDGTVAVPQRVLTTAPGTYVGGQNMVDFADVTGDGILDVIAYNYGNITVYPGEKGGTFSSTPLVALTSGYVQGREPEPADFNGDGIVDIPSLDQGSYRAGFHAGTNGGFNGSPALTDNAVADGHQIQASADFNHDGMQDIIVSDTSLNDNSSSFDPALLLGINDGKGNFTYTTIFTPEQMTTANAVAAFPVAADFNGDGNPDLLLETYSGIEIALNNGNGTFALPTNIQINNLTLPCPIESVDVGDINGDGKPDIVAAYEGDSSCYAGSTNPSGVLILLNQGGGNFSASLLPYGYGTALVKLGDVNGDGKLDLVTADAVDPYYNLYVIPGNGDGTFNVAASQFVQESTFVASLGVADLNGDGKGDIIAGVVTQVDGNDDVVPGTTATYIFPSNGDFTFQLPQQYDPGLYAVALTAADFNGDGRPDIAVEETQYDAYVYQPAGSLNTLVNLGGFAFADAPTVFTAGETIGGTIFAADYNGDGAIDTIAGFLVGHNTATAELLNLGGIAFTLNASSNSVSQDSPVTLTATATPTVSSASPTGTVTFYSGNSVIGSAPVQNGGASITLSNLPVGSDVITAAYSGDVNFNAATASASVTVTVAPLTPAFQLSAPTPGSLTLQPGQTGVLTIALTSNATFTGNISLSCSGAPSESTCAVSPAAVTLNGGQAGTVSIVVASTAKNSSYQASTFRALAGVSLAGLFAFILPWRRRLPKVFAAVLLLLAMGTMALSLSGCGGGSNNSGTPTGTSTLTVTASSGGVTQTQQFSLTIANVVNQ